MISYTDQVNENQLFNFTSNNSRGRQQTTSYRFNREVLNSVNEIKMTTYPQNTVKI